MTRLKDFVFRRRVLWGIGVGMVLAFGLSFLLVFQPRYLTKQLAAQNPDVLFFVETDQKVLALTIDDAPSQRLTPAILNLLEKHGVRATFFVIGDHALGNEELIGRMKTAGHELGNHLVHDEASIHLSEKEFARDLEAVGQLIGPLPGGKWCRPGSGWFSPEMVEIAHGLGYRCCLGSIYPFDNFLRQPNLIKRLVLARVQPGAILVLHEGDARRDYIVPLLEQLIPALKSRGYRFLTISELQELSEN